ncbi:MAG: AMP-binding protein [Pirellulales bacterium]
MKMELGNIVRTLQAHATRTPDECVLEFIAEDTSTAQSFTFRSLETRAQAIAAVLQSKLQPGDRAILMHPPGFEFVEAFFGCLFAGVVAVPVCIPRPRRPSRRFERLLESAQPSVVLSSESVCDQRHELFARIPDVLRLPWLANDRIGSNNALAWNDPDVDDSTLALLQYTSGTTGDPKGVMVSHGNLAFNAGVLRVAFATEVNRRGVLWLPMYHDMGLIGAMLQTVFDGAYSKWMPPSLFLKNPLNWLTAISETRGSVNGAPDFAYDYCVRRSTPATREGLNLSCWNVAINSAETVRPTTIDRFTEAFAPYGFRHEAFLPCYGLAEATLVVASEKATAPPQVITLSTAALSQKNVTLVSENEADARRVCSSGFVADGQTVAIVDPKSQKKCGADQIGEIWVSGMNVAQGYFNNPEATANTFRARLAEDQREYLRTGDLGFIRDGHLFVTGRVKELIIIRGRNFYPQDLEWTIRESHAAFRTTAAAAFAVELFGGERLVIVQEVERSFRHADFEELAQTVRAAVARDQDIEIFDLLFVRQGQVHRTTSGKIRRQQCRDDYLAERFVTLARFTDRGQQAAETAGPLDQFPADTEAPHRSVAEIEQWLLARIANRLNLDPRQVDMDKPFAELGLGSMDVVRITGEFELWLQRRLPPTMIFNYPTIGALAEYLGQTDTMPDTGPATIPMIPFQDGEDPLLNEVKRLSDEELEAFIAGEMANNKTPRKRAA